MCTLSYIISALTLVSECAIRVERKTASEGTHYTSTQYLVEWVGISFADAEWVSASKVDDSLIAVWVSASKVDDSLVDTWRETNPRKSLVIVVWMTT